MRNIKNHNKKYAKEHNYLHKNKFKLVFIEYLYIERCWDFFSHLMNNNKMKSNNEGCNQIKSKDMFE